MTAPANAGPPTVYPAFRFDDAPAAIDWLERAFGFRRGLVVPGEDGAIAHAELSFGAGGVMLGSPRKAPSDDPWADARFGLYVVVEKVDAHYEAAKAAGARIVREVNDTEYGSREYSALDLEGNLWSFGSYRPGDAGV
ncbi:VOC family protein [Methylopila turkensis]|uniref:VOC domain-containing protein n=1 Tax=Methylopila turkensis TaxID=1437816 RepID=A0A9W6JTH1_9HYPH|nr:VOC family protein [Methylopila turkensis]GLK81278.1 hypothetical protein GCM10008174_30190 [Methylopila turkensis]